MRATNWEFTNRALVFGLIFGFAFSVYVIDPQNSTAALANWLGARLHIIDADLAARLAMYHFFGQAGERLGSLVERVEGVDRLRVQLVRLQGV